MPNATRKTSEANTASQSPSAYCKYSPVQLITLDIRIPFLVSYILSLSRVASPMRLLSLGETDGVVANIVDGVPFPEESITKNGQRSYGLREVHTHQGRNAGSLNL